MSLEGLAEVGGLGDLSRLAGGVGVASTTGLVSGTSTADSDGFFFLLKKFVMLSAIFFLQYPIDKGISRNSIF